MLLRTCNLSRMANCCVIIGNCCCAWLVTATLRSLIGFLFLRFENQLKSTYDAWSPSSEMSTERDGAEIKVIASPEENDEHHTTPHVTTHALHVTLITSRHASRITHHHLQPRALSAGWKQRPPAPRTAQPPFSPQSLHD